MTLLKDLEIILASAHGKSYNKKNITANDINTLFKSDYSQAFENFKNGYYIFRGEEQEKPTKFLAYPNTRISANTSNIYTRLFSGILPSWQKFPKRNHSFICTNKIHKASLYGTQFLIFPKNNTKLGICSNSDIWMSVDLHTKGWSLNHFNVAFIWFLERIDRCNYKEPNYYDYEFINSTDQQLIDMLNTLSENLNEQMLDKIESFVDYATDLNYMQKEIVHILIKFLKKYKGDLIVTLNRILNADNNKNIVINLHDYNLDFKSYSREIWFDSPAIFIDAYTFTKLKLDIDENIKKEYMTHI